MGEIIATVVVAVIGSNLIQFFVTRWDTKRGIKDQLKKLEKDSVRTQMLVMMSDYPEERNEIMTLAEHYFRVLKGNWYLTELFTKWLKDNKLQKPSWLEGGEAK